MNEYISLQAVLDIVMQYCPDDDGSCSKADVDLREMLDEIEALPAADVQPVKHGEWKFYKNNGIYDTYKCSICKESFELSMDSDISKAMRYCPNCGAKMIKDGDAE